MSRRRVMLTAGSFWAGASEAGLSAGFRELGWAVQEVDQRTFRIGSGANLYSRISSRITRICDVASYRSRILNECQTLKPDVFFSVKGSYVDAGLLQDIRRTGARTIVYYPDYHFQHPDVDLTSFQDYDLFITTKSFQIEKLQALLGSDRVAYVPHGYSPSVHRPVYSHMSDDAFDVDILHAGNHSKYKQDWIEGAWRSMREASFRIVGNGWKAQASPEFRKSCDIQGARMAVAYAEAIQRARINIAVHMGPADSGWQDLVSTRTFEIPACGGFMLHIDNDEVREFFEPGTEIDVFSSHEELVDKAIFYIERPSLRNQMIERAVTRCVPTYSYNERARQIHNLINILP